MDDRALTKLDFDLLFRLVRNLTRVSVQSGLYGSAGQAIATSAADLPRSLQDLSAWGETKLLTKSPRRVEKTWNEKRGCLYVTPIVGFTGDVVGAFAAVTVPADPDHATVDSSAGSQDALVIQALDTAVSLIEKPVHLEAELDAMATELTGRYEELNLIYHRDDEIRDLDHEGEALRELIERCVQHLNISVVSLSIPRHDQTLFAVNEAGAIPDAHQLVTVVEQSLLTRLSTHRDCIVINEIDDPILVELDIPYKLMCVPVVDGFDKAFGMLTCINDPAQDDFTNSDRRLLKVVGRRIAKIFQNSFDELTGVYNRRVFESIVEESLLDSNKPGISHCLLSIDLDQLKVINDAIGRHAGDWIIERTAATLQSELTKSDSIGYLGEGKYAILLQHCDIDNGARIAEKLRSAIYESAVEWNDQSIDVSITIGVALVEPNMETANYILEAAEIALDSAKLNGRNQVRVFSHDDEYITARRTQLYWANRVQMALRAGEFSIYAQTIQSVLPSTERFHFEILIRLIDSNGDVVLPDNFIPAAEKFNLMPQVDRWVIDATFEFIAGHGLAQTEDEGIVSINLSGQSVADEDLANYIAQKLQQHSIDASCVCFEITETAAIVDFSSALRVFNQIREQGCHLSLDDFGTGLSSFSYLQSLPVDYVKIDGSFVKVILENDVSHAMVKSIIHVSRVMGLKSVAEYVENDAILAELEKMGVDYLQGYTLARPVPILEYLDAIDQPKSTPAGRRAS